MIHCKYKRYYTMKKKLLSFMNVAFIMLLTSCEEDIHGNQELSPLGWLIIIGLIAGFVFMFMRTTEEQTVVRNNLKTQGLSPKDFCDIGNYISGHPDINEGFEGAKILKKDNSLEIFDWRFDWKKPIKKAEIPIDSISDIKIQDATEIERKITLGRVVLVGIWALAWKKKKKNEMAFIEIDWKAGKFNNETIFVFEGNNAVQRANTCRNTLMKICTT